MRADDGVPILAQQPAGQRSQFCIPTPVRNAQIGLQSLIPTRRIGQTYFDLKPEFVEIVIIIRGRDGKRDGSRPRQGGLKHHVPGGFVPVIHIGHIKQIERHDAGVRLSAGFNGVSFL